jgi:hypothetical protein
VTASGQPDRGPHIAAASRTQVAASRRSSIGKRQVRESGSAAWRRGDPCTRSRSIGHRGRARRSRRGWPSPGGGRRCERAARSGRRGEAPERCDGESSTSNEQSPRAWIAPRTGCAPSRARRATGMRELVRCDRRRMSRCAALWCRGLSRWRAASRVRCRRRPAGLPAEAVRGHGHRLRRRDRRRASGIAPAPVTTATSSRVEQPEGGRATRARYGASRRCDGSSAARGDRVPIGRERPRGGLVHRRVVARRAGAGRGLAPWRRERANVGRRGARARRSPTSRRSRAFEQRRAGRRRTSQARPSTVGSRA